MQFVQNMLAQQRKRVVGSLMKYIESEVYPRLNEDEQRALRQKILAAVGMYHDVCLDMLKASVEDGSVVNEEALRLLAHISSRVQSLDRSLHSDAT